MLFSPWQLRSVKARNRIVISPMDQFSASNGFASDWHLVQLGRYALGGAGIVFVEATAITPEGRITSGDLGLWQDEQIAPLARIAKFLKEEGSIPAIQIAHAGRKANTRRPWLGLGPLTEQDYANGEECWQTVAPSALPGGEGWALPRELDAADLKVLRAAWRAAAVRALAAGFEIIELHAAHGYLLHEFLSPLANQRRDAYGGNFAGRIRFPLEVVEELREVIPAAVPFFVRVSAEDRVEGGWSLADTVSFAKELKIRGVDLVDCSSGGILGGTATLSSRPLGLGFQVPFAEAVRVQADIMTMAVGLIIKADQAEAILRNGQADLIAIGREALTNPNWPLHAERALHKKDDYSLWPKQFRLYLANRAQRLKTLGYPDWV
ncbi:MAG: NADH:flavin oxidoreductase/NADH oxidase [Candidatus Rokubacteria bacterium]|nr:NADH:flavin oxidoreductase/NADH oxidase [Candidatus Rokubacteria bacterium]